MNNNNTKTDTIKFPLGASTALAKVSDLSKI